MKNPLYTNNINILGKYDCVNESENCNILRPFSKLELYKENPSTGKEYTLAERNNKIMQYTNICELNSSIGTEGQISRNTLGVCCDKNDKNLSKLKRFIPRELRDKFKKIKVEQDENNDEIYRVCQSGNCNGYTTPNGYQLCKLINSNIRNGIATNITKDCLSGTCNSESMPFVINKNDKRYDYLEDMKLVDFVKNDNIEDLKQYSHKNKNVFSKTLSYGYPGNTLLHESIYQNADNCSYYLLENMTNIDIEQKNRDENTPLHVACLKKNINLINYLLKMGSNINSKNKFNETPLHTAIRSNAIETIRLLLINGSNINAKNKLGQSSLHIAVLTPKKNLEIIKLLLEYGSDILTKDNKNNNIMFDLNQQDSNVINKEISTHLTNALFKKYSYSQEKYNDVLKEYPEFSPYILADTVFSEDPENDSNNDENDDFDENNTINIEDDVTPKNLDFRREDIDGIKVVYNEDEHNKDLYRNKEQKALKVLPKSVKKFVSDKIEHFESNLENKNKLNIELYLMYFIFFVIISMIFYYNL